MICSLVTGVQTCALPISDMPAADDQQGPGQLLELERRRTGEIVHVLDPLNERSGRQGARGDDELWRPDQFAVHAHAAIGETRLSLQVGQAVVLGEKVGIVGLPPGGRSDDVPIGKEGASRYK